MIGRPHHEGSQKPADASWLRTLAYRQHKDRTPTTATRQCARRQWPQVLLLDPEREQPLLESPGALRSGVYRRCKTGLRGYCIQAEGFDLSFRAILNWLKMKNPPCEAVRREARRIGADDLFGREMVRRLWRPTAVANQRLS